MAETPANGIPLMDMEMLEGAIHDNGPLIILKRNPRDPGFRTVIALVLLIQKLTKLKGLKMPRMTITVRDHEVDRREVERLLPNGLRLEEIQVEGTDTVMLIEADVPVSGLHVEIAIGVDETEGHDLESMTIDELQELRAEFVEDGDRVALESQKLVEAIDQLIEAREAEAEEQDRLSSEE